MGAGEYGWSLRLLILGGGEHDLFWVSQFIVCCGLHSGRCVRVKVHVGLKYGIRTGRAGPWLECGSLTLSFGEVYH